MARELPDNYTYPLSGISHADIKKFKKVMYLPILTKPQNRLYDVGWERIFGKNNKKKYVQKWLNKKRKQS